MRASEWHPQYRRNVAAVLLSCWWLVFAGFSLYWAAGGLWLVDTAVEQEGRDLARQRPVWLVLVLVATGVFKLLFVLYGYLVVAPVGRKIPRFLYLLAGWGIGLGCIGYGLFFTLPLLPALFAGQMTAYRWARLVLWMPQFWVGGLLLILTALRFQLDSRPARRSLARVA